ncbi:MAG: hypothetical protein HY313_08885 [Acidobacteria bacterium]|nr:hypothetical protein [Acidobacteriota bacterium]
MSRKKKKHLAEPSEVSYAENVTNVTDELTAAQPESDAAAEGTSPPPTTSETSTSGKVLTTLARWWRGLGESSQVADSEPSQSLGSPVEGATPSPLPDQTLLAEETMAAEQRQLEALADSSRAADTGHDFSELQLRIRLLETQLDAARQELAANKEQSEKQVHKLREEHLELEQQLAAKEQELGALLNQTTEAQERASHLEAVLQRVQELGQLEAELAERNAQLQQLRATHPLMAAAEPSQTASASPDAASDTMSGLLPPEAISDFYQQAMSSLTVILAAADLLAMNQRLDSSLRETAREIRVQGQKVVGLVKGITYPEKTKKGGGVDT